MDNFSKEILRDQIAAKSAALTLIGVTVEKQIEELREEFHPRLVDAGIQLSLRTLMNYRTRTTYKDVMLGATDKVVKQAITELKQAVSGLVPDVIAALKQALKEGDIKAVPHALKILGIDTMEPTNQTQSITVMLPDMNKPSERDVNEN